jgi:hypothetical protein
MIFQLNRIERDHAVGRCASRGENSKLAAQAESEQRHTAVAGRVRTQPGLYGDNVPNRIFVAQLRPKLQCARPVGRVVAEGRSRGERVIQIWCSNDIAGARKGLGRKLHRMVDAEDLVKQHDARQRPFARSGHMHADRSMRRLELGIQ